MLVHSTRLTTAGAGVVGATWIVFAGAAYRPTGTAFAGVGCPIKHLTGFDCPGCGSTRALGALTRLDLGAALDHNVLVPIALVFVVASWIAWTWATWAGRAAPSLVRGPRSIISIAVLVAMFTALRNLDAGAWLASDLASVVASH